MSEECSLCRIVNNVCDSLPDVKAKLKCKELSDKVIKGEIDGSLARQELLKYVDEKTLAAIVNKVLQEARFIVLD